MKFLLFDSLFYFFAAITYSCSIYLSYLFVEKLWSDYIFFNSFLVFVGLIVFIHIFVVILILLKKLFQPRLIVGQFPVGLNKHYIAWGLNSIFCGIFQTSPFAQIGHIIFSINWLFYRGMGMKINFSSLIGLKSTIRQPELISVGERSIIGLGAILTCHFTADGKVHTQKSINIGNQSVVGGYAGLSPGVVIGNQTVIGAESRVFPDVKIGNRVKIGAFCYIDHGVTIPDDVDIKSYSRITKQDLIRPFDIWSGNPAKKIGEKT